MVVTPLRTVLRGGRKPLRLLLLGGVTAGLVAALLLVETRITAVLVGPDRTRGHTEIYVSDSARVANGVEGGEKVTVNVVNRTGGDETYSWHLRVRGSEHRTGSFTLPSDGRQTIVLWMPELEVAANAEFSLAGKPQTLRWKVRGAGR